MPVHVRRVVRLRAARSPLVFGLVLLAGLFVGAAAPAASREASATRRFRSGAGVAAGTLDQVEMDRIVSRVGGRIITQSDVRQARALGLVADTSSDEAAQRALEDRLLILSEMERAAPVPPPSDQAVAARRAAWTARHDPAGRMSDAEIDAWIRDDLRIEAFLQRQFGMLPAAERDRARTDWLARLRQRADLD